MLYYLFRFLGEYGIPGSHMWTYISFRALLTLILVVGHFRLVRGILHQMDETPQRE